MRHASIPINTWTSAMEIHQQFLPRFRNTISAYKKKKQNY